MISLSQLWLPILLGAVTVFVTSSLVHMVFKWHNSHYLKFPNEDEVRAAIGKGSPAPGHYVVPWCVEGKDMQTPEMQQKFKDGPIGHFFIAANGVPNLGKHLGSWFALAAFIATGCACIAGMALPGGTAPMTVFKMVASIAFLAYGAGPMMDAIWHARPVRETLLDLLDALIYGASTAVPFALLWPHA